MQVLSLAAVSAPVPLGPGFHRASRLVSQESDPNMSRPRVSVVSSLGR